MQMRAESHKWYRQQLQVSACAASTSTINIMLCCSSIEIKVDLSRWCLSLLNSSVLVLSPSVTSIVHCFALMPVHFDQVHSVFEAGTDSHERAAIGEILRLGLREALSSFPAPPQANVLAFTTMLCLLRQIESSLLMSAFCTLLRFGNDAACRFFSSRMACIVAQLDDFAAGRWRGCRNMTCFACSSRLQKKRKNTETRLFFRLLFELHRRYENNWG